MCEGNEYVIQVKANQPILLERIHQICDIEIPVDTNGTIENNRGRTVKRETQLYVVTKVDTIQLQKQFKILLLIRNNKVLGIYT